MARTKFANMTLRIEPEKYEHLKRLADQRGLSIAEMLREMGDAIIERDGVEPPHGHSWSALRTVWPRLDANDRYIVARTAKGLAALHEAKDGKGDEDEQ